MHKFIRNIIERLRSFIRRGNRDSTCDTATPIGRDEASLAATCIDRFRTAVLTRSGILFKGIRYHNQTITEMLLDDLSPLESGPHARAKVTIKWDPSDVRSIGVWNCAASPYPRWVTVPFVDRSISEKLSFAHHESVREFAKAQFLAFRTEEERSEARERLRQHWEKLADLSPIRENRRSPSDADPWGDPLDDLIIDNTVAAEIATSAANRNSPRGRKPSKAAADKAKRTRATKEAETTKARKPRAAPNASNHKECME